MRAAQQQWGVPSWILSLCKHHADNDRDDNCDNDGNHHGHNVFTDGHTNGSANSRTFCGTKCTHRSTNGMPKRVTIRHSHSTANAITDSGVVRPAELLLQNERALHFGLVWNMR